MKISSMCTIYILEQRKTEKEMDRRRQAQHGWPAAQRGGCQESSWMEKENPCGRPLTWGIHSLKERERERFPVCVPWNSLSTVYKLL